VIRWICNHPTAYVNITGVLYTVPYGVIAWGCYIQGLALPLWVALALGALYNTLWTWARIRVARPARRMDRQDAAVYGARYGRISDYDQADTLHSRAMNQAYRADRQ
jgi:hypothetical protein